MKKTKFKLERKTAFDFKSTMGSEYSKSVTGHPTTTTATTVTTISFTCPGK